MEQTILKLQERINSLETEIKQLKRELNVAEIYKAANKSLLEKWEKLSDATKKHFADLYADAVEVKQQEAVHDFIEELKAAVPEVEPNACEDCSCCNLLNKYEVETLIDKTLKQFMEERA